MSFQLGKKSLENIQGVHPWLFAVVRRAIEITKVDFGVAAKVVRTAEEQNALFKKGASQKDGYKNKSNHQTHSDGYGYSVDLTAWVNGKWEFDDWECYYEIAAAMAQAALELRVHIRWGGNWQKTLDAYPASVAGMKQAVEDYKRDHPGPDFLDGPHFELVV